MRNLYRTYLGHKAFGLIASESHDRMQIRDIVSNIAGFESMEKYLQYLPGLGFSCTPQRDGYTEGQDRFDDTLDDRKILYCRLETEYPKYLPGIYTYCMDLVYTCPTIEEFSLCLYHVNQGYSYDDFWFCSDWNDNSITPIKSTPTKMVEVFEEDTSTLKELDDAVNKILEACNLKP